MRNILALVAAFTLSTTSTMSVLACDPASDRGTTHVFDWDQAFKAAGRAGETTSDFFNFLNSQGGQSWGKDLYSTINQRINLSILKNNPKYKSDYAAALITVNSQIDNKIASLKAKFGRGWEKQWKEILKGYNKSVEQYKDDQLKEIATRVINNSYVSQNYEDYEYYTTSQIYPMLRSVFEDIKHGIFADVNEYINGKSGKKGLYWNTIWIVIKGNDSNGNAVSLTNAIKENKDWNSISVSNPVAKTVDDIEEGEYISSTYNTINGLLSDNQKKIAQVMMTAQEPIWTRQIVVPFNDSDKDNALKVAIDEKQFSNKEKTINTIINDIKESGFDQTFTNTATTGAGTPTTTGDLGLVNINSATKDTAAFDYYLSRYVTSATGVGKNVTSNIQPYILNEYTPTGEAGENCLTTLLPNINHTNTTSKDTTSQYNDLVYMADKTSTTSLLPDVANNGPGVGIFIDAAGIHFIQTPGITYQPTPSNDKIYDIIQQFNKKNKQTLRWDDVSPLADRQDGLSNSPYLDYLQTVFLLQKNKGNDKNITIDLNKALSDFTATSTDLGSPNWWDYNLFFDDNASLIHWNVSELTGSNPSLTDTDTSINQFAKSLQTWFNNVKNSRWDNKQALYVNGHFQNNVKLLNKDWDGFGINAPPARLNENISDYLTKIGKQTLWWYDQNIITNN